MNTEVKIDTNIIECFSYLLNVEFFLGSNRVAVKDRVVRSPNGRQNLYSFLLFLGSTFSQLYYQNFYYSDYLHKKDIVVYISNAFGQITPFISYLTCLLIGRFTKQSENIEIFTKFHNMDRILGLKHHRYFTKFQARLHNTLATLIVVLFPIGFMIYAADVVDKPLYIILLVPCYLTFYVDFVLFGGLLLFICIRMSILIKLLKNQIHCCEDESRQEWSFLVRLFLFLTYPSVDRIGEQTTLTPDKWMQCLEEILKAYQITTHISSYQILNVTSILFLWTFLAIGAIVSALVAKTFTFTAAALVGTWIIFYFVLLAVITIINDCFLYQVKRFKLLCVRIMYYDFNDNTRKAARRMLRIINDTDPKFVVYGVFTLNSGLILTLIGVIATNVVVLIQFVVSND